MSEPESPRTPTLDYSSPSDVTEQPSVVLAILLCLPGAMCWFLYGSRMLSIHLPPSATRAVFWPCWILAVATAMYSMVLYLPRASRIHPWYVVINLVINVPGLLF